MMTVRNRVQLALKAFGLALSSLSAQGNDYGPGFYYFGADGLTGSALKTFLHNIIDNHQVIIYTQTDEFMRVADASETAPGQIKMMYSDQEMYEEAIGASGPSFWNREHLWPQSYGTGDGEARSDLHALFPCNAQVNSSRSNLAYDYSTGSISSDPLAPDASYDINSWEPPDEDKGLVARACFYLATRYDGDPSDGTPRLSLGNRPNSGFEVFGFLNTLLEWNRRFPPSEYERKRNHLIYTGVQFGSLNLRQGNRNPFVDYPEMADSIFALIYHTVGAWRVEHFTLIELDDEAVSGDTRDPDKDGRLNLLEAYQNDNPRSGARTRALGLETNQAGEPIFVFDRIKQAELSGLVADIEFAVGELTPETPWQTFAGPLETTDLPGDGSLPTMERVRANLANVTAEGRLFVRLTVRVDWNAILAARSL